MSWSVRTVEKKHTRRGASITASKRKQASTSDTRERAKRAVAAGSRNRRAAKAKCAKWRDWNLGVRKLIGSAARVRPTFRPLSLITHSMSDAGDLAAAAAPATVAAVCERETLVDRSIFFFDAPVKGLNTNVARCRPTAPTASARIQRDRP